MYDFSLSSYALMTVVFNLISCVLLLCTLSLIKESNRGIHAHIAIDYYRRLLPEYPSAQMNSSASS